MKLAFVLRPTSRGPVLIRRDDSPLAITVFRWVEAIPVEGGWTLHFLVFCNAVTERLDMQSRQGVFAVGWLNGLFIEFTPRVTTHRLWLYPAIRYEKGTIQ